MMRRNKILKYLGKLHEIIQESPSLGDTCRTYALAGEGRRQLLEVGTWRGREREMKRSHGQQKDPQRAWAG